jgi:hypothetical protein
VDEVIAELKALQLEGEAAAAVTKALATLEGAKATAAESKAAQEKAAEQAKAFEAKVAELSDIAASAGDDKAKVAKFEALAAEAQAQAQAAVASNRALTIQVAVANAFNEISDVKKREAAIKAFGIPAEATINAEGKVVGFTEALTAFKESYADVFFNGTVDSAGAGPGGNAQRPGANETRTKDAHAIAAAAARAALGYK